MIDIGLIRDIKLDGKVSQESATIHFCFFSVLTRLIFFIVWCVFVGFVLCMSFLVTVIVCQTTHTQ